MTNEPRSTTCPVCLGAGSRLLWGATAAQAAQHFVLKEKNPDRHARLASHLGTLWGRERCEVVRCDHCGFCYADPYIAGDDQFYALAYERHASSYPGWKWEFEQTCRALSEIRPGPNARLLEI